MARISNFFTASIAAIILWLSITIGTFAGWLTHIVYCFQNHEWFLLIAGAIFFPLGVIHGWGLWFHWWH